MATTVILIEGRLTATVKKHLIAVVKSGEYFGQRLKVTNVKMMVEDLGENKYKVTEYVNRPSMISGGTYEEKFESIALIKNL